MRGWNEEVQMLPGEGDDLPIFRQADRHAAASAGSGPRKSRAYRAAFQRGKPCKRNRGKPCKRTSEGVLTMMKSTAMTRKLLNIAEGEARK